MGTWFTVAVIILLVATLAMIFARRSGRGLGQRVGGASGYESGTLTVTGVSGRGDADKNGVAYFTVSGTIIGNGTAPTEVYRTMLVNTGDPDPYIGQDMFVVYKPGKAATTWRFGTLGE